MIFQLITDENARKLAINQISKNEMDKRRIEQILTKNRFISPVSGFSTLSCECTGERKIVILTPWERYVEGHRLNLTIWGFFVNPFLSQAPMKDVVKVEIGDAHDKYFDIDIHCPICGKIIKHQAEIGTRILSGPNFPITKEDVDTIVLYEDVMYKIVHGFKNLEQNPKC